MLIDLHVHTTVSPCSCLKVETILDQAMAVGLDGVCLTDHDTMEIGARVREGLQADGLLVIVGMEYATPQGDYLIFGPFEDIKPGMDAPAMFAAVNKHGGVAIGAHPYRKMRPANMAMFAPGKCMIAEVSNGRNSLSENARALNFAQSRELSMTAGSDAHTLEELGTHPTRFIDRITNREDLVASLRSGRFRPSKRAFAAGLKTFQTAS